MKAKLARVTFKFLRTARYLTELLVWSRIFVVRRTSANIRINHALRTDKGIDVRQPQIQITGPTPLDHFQHGFDIVYDLLFANLRKANRLLPFRHALPGPAFAGVYLWDSAFIALIWRYWDSRVATDVLQSVIAVREGDKLQHVVADFVRSEFTQPPLIAWALVRARLHEALTEAELREIYAALKAYNLWLNRNRRLNSGLYFWEHPYESGVENSPRFSSRDEKILSDTRRFAAPDLSAYVVLQCEALAVLAARVEGPGAEQLFLQEAQRIKLAMEERLWHEEDGLYYDLDETKNEHIRSCTIASLIPLAAGVPSAPRAQRLRQLICDPSAFNSRIPLPSVALGDPQFEKDMWRGPVWINTAFLVLDGLQRYGYARDYGEMAWRLCDGVFHVLQNEHQVYEFYDPEYFHTRELCRKKGNRWKAFTLGRGPQKDFVGWSGLVNVLVIEALFGMRVAAGNLVLQPALPVSTAGNQFTLSLPQMEMVIWMEVHPDGRHTGNISLGARAESFDLAPGGVKTIPLCDAQ